MSIYCSEKKFKPYGSLLFVCLSKLMPATGSVLYTYLCEKITCNGSIYKGFAKRDFCKQKIHTVNILCMYVVYAPLLCLELSSYIGL